MVEQVGTAAKRDVAQQMSQQKSPGHARFADTALVCRLFHNALFVW